METITFDNEKATAVEIAVSKVFECRRSEIVSLKDTLVKKVVVFILFKTENYNSHVLAANYQISYLYVPTIVNELEYMFNMDPFFNAKIMIVLRLVGCVDLNR